MKKKSGKDSEDINILVKSIVDAATNGQSPTEDTMRAVMREMGRRGGLKGGKARADKLSSRRRKDIATEAAIRRWKRKR